MPSLSIIALTDMVDREALEEWLAQLMELKEDRFFCRISTKGTEGM